MTSLAVGKTFGTAKKAKVTMARVDNVDVGLKVERSIDAMATTYDEIQNTIVGRPDKVVVSMSWGVDQARPTDSEDEKKYFEALSAAQAYLINAFIKTGIVLPVVAVGQVNSADTTTVSHLKTFEC